VLEGIIHKVIRHMYLFLKPSIFVIIGVNLLSMQVEAKYRMKIYVYLFLCMVQNMHEYVSKTRI
jgi:hypothetical protein